MFLLGFRRKMTAPALCMSVESAIQWFQIHHRITFANIQNPAVYLSGARVSIFSTLIPRLLLADENQRSIQIADFDLVNTYFGIDVVHTAGGIYVTV